MKIIIDLESIDSNKQDWLLNTLNFASINYKEAEDWDEQALQQYNRDIDEAVARYEAGEPTTSVEELKRDAVMVVEFDVIAKKHLREVYEHLKKSSVR